MSLVDGSVVAAAGGPVENWLGYWEAFLALPAAARAIGIVALTIVLAVIVVGLFPEYGQRSADNARRHVIASTLIGSIVAGLFVGSVGALWYAATQSEVVSLLAMPVLFVLTGIALVWLLIGVVALGEFVAAVGGHDTAAWGVLVASLLVGLGAFFPKFGAVVLVIAALLGFGSGIRTNPFSKPPTERKIPPNHQH